MKRRWMAAAMTAALLCAGCAAEDGRAPQTAQTPRVTAQQATPSPEPTRTAEPTASPVPKPTHEPMPVTVAGKALSTHARTMQGKIMLPLLETMERLSYRARVNELRENDGTRRVHTFTKGETEIAVSYLITDNTVSDVSFVRGKLIVPVDRLMLFEDEIAYAPANFFEEAADVTVAEENGLIRVEQPQTHAQATEIPAP